MEKEEWRRRRGEEALTARLVEAVLDLRGISLAGLASEGGLGRVTHSVPAGRTSVAAGLAARRPFCPSSPASVDGCMRIMTSCFSS